MSKCLIFSFSFWYAEHCTYDVFVNITRGDRHCGREYAALACIVAVPVPSN